MGVGYAVRITPQAQNDLQSIFDYIAKDSPNNAAGMIERLLGAIYELDHTPYRYAVPRRGRRRFQKYRCMPVGNYLVTYRIEKAGRIVRVLDIRHGARQR